MKTFRSAPLLFLTTLALAACSGPNVGPDGAVDGSSGIDALDAAMLDATDAVTPADATMDAPRDASPDAPVIADAGDASDGSDGSDGSDASDANVATDVATDAPDATPPFGCNPDQGIECDGDWAGRCPVTCPTDQCCSPQSGHFQCVAREANGACPAADLWVDRAQIVNQYTVEWTYFSPGDCAIAEHCVDAAGWRRLLRFSTFTPNTGTADMYLGDPTNPLYADHFTYSACHGHYHFDTYAQYTLSDPTGGVAARGHKQAFCLLDLQQYAANAGSGSYSCGNQGISRGWEDVYNSGLDCQWVDVTDVPAGTYTLRIDLNSKHVLNESNYDNNVTEVPVNITPGVSPGSDAGVNTDGGGTDVVIVPGDPTSPCPSGSTGPQRDCGWTIEGTHTCTPGTPVSVGCADACGLGSCVGDTVMRVCAGTRSCTGTTALGSNDDVSMMPPPGCTPPACNTTTGGGGCCSLSTVMCPATGEITVMTASYFDGNPSTCNVVTR